MIKVNDSTIEKIYLGSIPVTRIYEDLQIVFDTGTPPTPQPCFEVVNDIIEASGNYVDVYSKNVSMWYKRNNLNQYELYGIMPVVYSLSSITYYTGKRVILKTDNHEYKWNGSQWNDVGSVGGELRYWLLPSAQFNKDYTIPISYHWGTGYKMEICYIFTGNSSGVLTYQYINDLGYECPVTIYTNAQSSHSIQLRTYYPASSDDPSVTSRHDSTISNFLSNQDNLNKPLIFTCKNDRLVITDESTGTVIGSAGSSVSVTGWYSGLYNAEIKSYYYVTAKITYIKVYDGNGNLIHDIEPRMYNQDLILYDSITSTGYVNISTNQIVYESEETGTFAPPDEYDTKVAPPDYVQYETLEELEMMECPWIGMHAVVGGSATYIYTVNGWKFEPQPYLTFIPIDPAGSTFSFSKAGLSYSLDLGETWTSIASRTNTPLVAQNEKIMFKSTIAPAGGSGIGGFTASGRFNAEGNIMSMLFGDNFKDHTSLSGKNYAFLAMFAGTPIVDASRLIMPATTLSRNCYTNLFNGCSQLTTAPTLPALTLTTNCYNGLFTNCSSLNYIKAMFITTPSGSNCNNWVGGVAATGTFVKNVNATWDIISANGVPADWTIVTESPS